MIYYIRFTICRAIIKRTTNYKPRIHAVNNDVKNSRNKRKSKTAIIEQLYIFFFQLLQFRSAIFRIYKQNMGKNLRFISVIKFPIFIVFCFYIESCRHFYCFIVLMLNFSCVYLLQMIENESFQKYKM